LLVVGFSCVDFSTLNTKKKKLESMGESGVTFTSVTQYMARARPPLVVLENVCGAPWESIKKVISDIGYDCYHVKVDTKDYYYPQTRERGYMFCIDRNKLPAPLEENGFSNLMKRFERKASAPVTQFLLRDHDPRLEDARADISASTRTKQDVDWTRYKARHLKYRQDNNLGMKRPLSKWQDNGTCTMPDFSWHDWVKRQTERVWDTLDINFLRTLKRYYDILFKLLVSRATTLPYLRLS
jgi:site-specific DNA-cytosine methylase